MSVQLAPAGCASVAPPTQATLATPVAAPTPRLAATSTVVPGGDPQRGEQLITQRGCGGCHTVPGVGGATGVAGPVLNNTTLRPTIAGNSIPTSPDNMVAFLMDPQALKPGALMPSVGLTEQEARDITAFLFDQPSQPQP